MTDEAKKLLKTVLDVVAQLQDAGVISVSGLNIGNQNISLTILPKADMPVFDNAALEYQVLRQFAENVDPDALDMLYEIIGPQLKPLIVDTIKHLNYGAT